jgi:hypothetical protein
MFFKNNLHGVDHLLSYVISTTLISVTTPSLLMRGLSSLNLLLCSPSRS